MIVNEDQITYWNEVAGAKWVANQTRLDRLMAPMTDSLLAGAGPQLCERALDVGCGCGDLSLRLAQLLGPSGQVTAVDVSRPMLAHGEARAKALAYDDRAAIDWRCADAMTHRFEPTADLLISRYGVMFFDDRPRAFRNLHGALRPGGRFAFLTWRPRAENEWMQAPLDWIVPAIPMPEDSTGEIGPFGLADADATREVFAGAGFRDLSVERVEHLLLIGTSVDEAFELLTDAGPASRALRDAEPDAQAEARRLMRERLAAIARPNGVVMGGACWLYRGRA